MFMFAGTLFYPLPLGKSAINTTWPTLSPFKRINSFSWATSCTPSHYFLTDFAYS